MKELQELGDDPFVVRRSIARRPSSGHQFAAAVVDGLAVAVRELESNPQHVATEGEVSITDRLVVSLRVMGFHAQAEAAHGGHCDILVEDGQLQYQWIAEAKIWDGPQYAASGLVQLLGRYTAGHESSTALLLYVQSRDARGKLSSWRDHLVENALEGLVGAASLDGLTFASTHTHHGSGLEVSVLHWAVTLFHSSSG